MAVLATQTIIGTVGQVHKKRTIGDGTSVLDFSVAVTHKKKVGEEWVDEPTYWVNATAWNRLADNISESWNSGDRVFLHGRITMKPAYTKKNDDGTETQMPARPHMTAEFAGHENSYHTTSQARPNRGGGQSSNGGGQGQSRSTQSSNVRAAQDVAKKATAPAPAAKKDEYDIFSDDLGGDFNLDDAPF